MSKFLRTYLLLTLLLLPAALQAQVGAHRNDFSIGASIGWNMNRRNFVPSIKQSYKQSPIIGFTARYICEKYFTCIAGVQAEVNYNNMGWKEKIEDGSNNTYSRDLHYIEVPILMQKHQQPSTTCRLPVRPRPRPQVRLRYSSRSWCRNIQQHRTFYRRWTLLLWTWRRIRQQQERILLKVCKSNYTNQIDLSFRPN